MTERKEVWTKEYGKETWLKSGTIVRYNKMSGKTKSPKHGFSRNSHSVEQETLVEKETMFVKTDGSW